MWNLLFAWQNLALVYRPSISKKKKKERKKKEEGVWFFPIYQRCWILVPIPTNLCRSLPLEKPKQVPWLSGCHPTNIKHTLLEPKVVWHTLICDASLFTYFTLPLATRLSHMEAPGTHPIRWPITSARWQVRCNPTREIRWKMLKMSGGKYWTSDPLQH